MYACYKALTTTVSKKEIEILLEALLESNVVYMPHVKPNKDPIHYVFVHYMSFDVK